MHIFDVIIFFKLHTMQLGTFSFHQLPGTQPTKISWFNCFLLYCTQLEKDDYIENVHVLSCFVVLKSVLLFSCVFWIFFSERWQSTLFQNFFYFFILQPVSSIFPCCPLPAGTWQLQACPFSDVVFPPLPLSTLSSSPFHCALQDGFGQTYQ